MAPSLATRPSQIVRTVPTNPLQVSVKQNLLQVLVLAVGASIGSLGTPGIPAEGIALILDMSRTTLNAAGDPLAACD